MLVPKHNLLRLYHKQIENVNISVTTKETDTVVKKKKKLTKSQDQMAYWRILSKI